MAAAADIGRSLHSQVDARDTADAYGWDGVPSWVIPLTRIQVVSAARTRTCGRGKQERQPHGRQPTHGSTATARARIRRNRTWRVTSNSIRKAVAPGHTLVRPKQHVFGPDSACKQPQESPTAPKRKSDNAVASRRSGAQGRERREAGAIQRIRRSSIGRVDEFDLVGYRRYPVTYSVYTVPQRFTSEVILPVTASRFPTDSQRRYRCRRSDRRCGSRGQRSSCGRLLLSARPPY